MNDAYGANAGITYTGFSIDGFYTKENGAFHLRRTAFLCPRRSLRYYYCLQCSRRELP